MNGIPKIVPCLWFDKECEEAINLYVEIFNVAPHMHADSRIVSITLYEKGMEAPRSGSVGREGNHGHLRAQRPEIHGT